MGRLDSYPISLSHTLDYGPISGTTLLFSVIHRNYCYHASTESYSRRTSIASNLLVAVVETDATDEVAVILVANCSHSQY